jgi:competence protein ComEA
MDFDTFKERFLDFTIEQRRALISISLVAVALASYFSLASRAQPVHSAEPIQIERNQISDTSTSLLFIHVAGKVHHPGVYPVVRGSRVIDAVKAAGGPLPSADLSEVNLARVVIDGEQIYLPALHEGMRSSDRVSSSGKININRAGTAQFDSLPGIGPVIASRIVQYRKTNGPFASLEDMKKVEGVGEKLFSRIKDRLSL